MHPDKIHTDGTIRAVIVPDSCRGSTVTQQGDYVEAHLYFGPHDDVYAGLSKLTNDAMEMYR